MSKTDKVALTAAGLSELMGIMANAPNPESAFAALEDAANRFIGHRLFTVMAFNAEAMQVQRLYSSDPQAYPAGGKKDKRDTQWGRLVLEEGHPFIGRNAEDIRANFRDHEVILGLGLGSVLNVPVRSCGRTIGTMNLLHEQGYYRTADLGPGFMLAGLLVGPICFEML